ncbi:MAG: hypothetical protein WCL50_06610 [Spirochaetota bacterium]
MGELKKNVTKVNTKVLARLPLAALAIERILDLLVSALKRDKPRRATKPSHSSREKRLASKRRDSDTKRGRSAGYED